VWWAALRYPQDKGRSFPTSLDKFRKAKKTGFSNFQKLINTFWGSIG
jgi:hypothetical protein